LINNESVFAGSKNNYESVLENDIFAGLFSDSASSGKLFNATITDYAPALKKARVSVGNVPVGIYRQGPKHKSILNGKTPHLAHNRQKEPEIYEIFHQVKHKGNYYASVRNFYAKMIMNFGINDLFLCLTFNNDQKNLQFRRSP
jgi:hypothetical protein